MPSSFDSASRLRCSAEASRVSATGRRRLLRDAGATDPNASAPASSATPRGCAVAGNKRSGPSMAPRLATRESRSDGKTPHPAATLPRHHVEPPRPHLVPRLDRPVFASARIAAMLGLGFASGLPLALSSGTLQAWLTVEGIDIKTIGIFALAGLPYTFKFVWAPLLDRFEPPFLGRRRRGCWSPSCCSRPPAGRWPRSTRRHRSAARRARGRGGVPVGLAGRGVRRLPRRPARARRAGRRRRGVGARLPLAMLVSGGPRADPRRPVARLAEHLPPDGRAVRRDGRHHAARAAHPRRRRADPQRRAPRVDRLRRDDRGGPARLVGAVVGDRRDAARQARPVPESSAPTPSRCSARSPPRCTPRGGPASPPSSSPGTRSSRAAARSRSLR